MVGLLHELNKNKLYFEALAIQPVSVKIFPNYEQFIPDLFAHDSCMNAYQYVLHGKMHIASVFGKN